MRRLYILLAAALIASSILALAGGSAGASSTVAKPYLAMAVAPSVVKSYGRSGSTLQMAKKLALQKCRYDAAWSASYANDCQAAVWVYNGSASVAFERTKEEPYKNLAWGSGWGRSEEDAKYWARRSCRSAASEKCTIQNTKQAKYLTTGKVTGGGW